MHFTLESQVEGLNTFALWLRKFSRRLELFLRVPWEVIQEAVTDFTSLNILPLLGEEGKSFAETAMKDGHLV